MASNQTSNYGLSQWDATDAVQRLEFNADNAKVDAALDTLAGQVAEKVSTTDFSVLSQTVEAHASAIAQMGNCTIQVLSYVGTGSSGQSTPTVINFPKRPVFFLVTGYQALLVGFGAAGNQATLIVMNQYGTGCREADLVWSGNQARIWWQEPIGQLNAEGKTYCVLALYGMEAE